MSGSDSAWEAERRAGACACGGDVLGWVVAQLQEPSNSCPVPCGGSFLSLCLDECHRVTEFGLSLAHPKSLIASEWFVTVVFVFLQQREMNPINLCCLYRCSYRVQLPTERFLGHTGFSTKELHSENLRPHPIRQKEAFASVWVNHLLIAG